MSCIFCTNIQNSLFILTAPEVDTNEDYLLEVPYSFEEIMEPWLENIDDVHVREPETTCHKGINSISTETTVAGISNKFCIGRITKPLVSTDSTCPVEKDDLSDLDEEQLDIIQKVVKPKTTLRTENWAMNRFNGTIICNSRDQPGFYSVICSVSQRICLSTRPLAKCSNNL